MSEPDPPKSGVRAAVFVVLLAIAAVFIVNASGSGAPDYSQVEAAMQARTQTLSVVATDYERLIDFRFPGSEAQIEALRAYGTQQMCDDFLNSGNSTLAKAAVDWAVATGYVLAFDSASANGRADTTGKATAGPTRSEGPTWGQAQNTTFGWTH